MLVRTLLLSLNSPIISLLNNRRVGGNVNTIILGPGPSLFVGLTLFYPPLYVVGLPLKYMCIIVITVDDRSQSLHGRDQSSHKGREITEKGDRI